MRFFSDRIITKPISLGEALEKAKNKPAQRTLDEMLGDLDEKGQIKTASVKPAMTKVADVTEEEALASSLTEGEEDTSAVASGEALTLEDAKETKEAHAAEAAADPSGPAMATQPEQSPVPQPAPEVKAAESTVKLTIASKINFTKDWKHEDVVKAWKQHGSMEKCMANVKGQTNNPKMYCGLLQVASKKIEAQLKKTAAKKPQPAVFKKIAKLTPEEKAFLKGYFRQLYGEGYVDSLLADY